ncbi:MAG TPA: sulfotransferase [Nordella sp.]|nr:sulfotransferase [Nordella sp.]
MASLAANAADDRFALALGKQAAGDLQQAAALYHEALNSDPDNAEAYHNLGLIVLERAGPGAAIPFLWHAARLRPRLSDAHNSLANAFARIGKGEMAEQSYRRAIETAPGNARFHFNLASLLHGQGRAAEAEPSFREAITLDPDYRDACNNLANLLRSTGRPDAALAMYRRAVAIDPRFAMAHNNIGNILRDRDELGAAERCYRESIELAPGEAITYFNLGNALRDQGRMAEAAANFRKTIELRPSFADAYRHLTQVERLKTDDVLVAFMQERHADPLTSEQDRVHLGFALGRVFDENKDCDRAFGYFRAANRLHRKTFTYDIRSEDAHLKRIRGFFPTRAVGGGGVDDETPIFIVGMMRSGTTLMEQILASHPSVAGGGELTFIQDVVDERKALTGKPSPDCLAGLTAADAARLGAAYIARVRGKYGAKARFVTDKMPQNFLHLGLIDRILPKARIIYMKREPMDVCLSIFTFLFTTEHFYAYDLREIGRYHRFSEQVMRHWIDLFPGKIHIQSYEDLVADSEGSIRKVLDFCGLPFHENCLEFHKTKRNVSTASAAQVREKLNARSVDRWKGYGGHLRELTEALAGR